MIRVSKKNVKAFGLELWWGRYGRWLHTELWNMRGSKPLFLYCWYPNSDGKKLYIRGLDWMLDPIQRRN